MRYELKITLPIYKIVYSIAFMVIIVLVSPINSFSGIIRGSITRTELADITDAARQQYKERMDEIWE